MLIPTLAESLLSSPLSLNDASTLLSQAGTTLIVAQAEANHIGSSIMAAAPSTIYDNLLSTFDPTNHPLTTILTSYCLVTASDMIPFLPCQPLAIALGAKLGFELAFPITALGQATAGVLAFTAARRLSNSQITRDAVSNKLSPEAMEKLEEFRQLTSSTTTATTAEDQQLLLQGDAKILVALIGLRLAPFFPFSAGNYLLGGTTSVPLRLFVIATVFGCLLSNFVSVSVGAGGAMVFANEFHL